MENGQTAVAAPEWLQQIFDSIYAGIFLHDINTGRILEVNKRVQEMYGYTPDEIRRMGVGELSSDVPPYTSVEAWARMQKAAAGEPQFFEWHAKDRAGRLFWAEVNIQRVAIGSRNYLMVTVRDISGRKKAEEDIRQREQRYREIFELTEDGIFIVSVTTEGRFRFLEFNPEAEQMTGLKTELVRDKYPEDILPPEAAASINANYRRCFEAGKTIRYEETLNVPSGEITTDTTLIPLKDEKGRIFRLIGVAHFVGEARRREKELAQEKAFSDAVISSIPGTFLVLDARGLYVRWNKMIEDLLGKTSDELYHFEGINLIYGPDRPAVWAGIRLTLEKGYSEGEARVLGKDGVPREFFFVGRKVSIGGSDYVIVTGIDIAERIRAEKALKESNAKLRQTVNSVIDTITTIVEVRDPYTAGHQHRVSLLATAIAREMGLPRPTVESVRIASLMHDVGKIYVPSEILSRPGALSDAERSILRTYPQASFDILRNIQFPWPIARIAFEHQERFNGSGYPRHLAGSKILIAARVIAVADVVEAMLSHRPYRGAKGIDETMDEIVRNRGILFDPAVVDACLRVFSKNHFSFQEAEESKEEVKIE